MHYFSIYVIAINLFTFGLYGIDKWRAKHHKWRISEKMLLGFSFFGGAAGGWIAMQIFRHKTQKTKFRYGIPLMILMQLIFVYYACTMDWL